MKDADYPLTEAEGPSNKVNMPADDSNGKTSKIDFPPIVTGDSGAMALDAN